MNIGIFGGSFDPVHNGHINLVKNFIENLPLDKVFVIPAFVSPFKTLTPPKVSPENRMALLNLAFENVDKVEIIRDEIDKKEVSYSIDTIRLLKKRFPDDSLYLLLSVEMKPYFSRWKNFEEIEKLVQVKYGEVSIPISSTILREKLKKRELCQEFFPVKVLDYIEKHGLYSL